MISSAQLIQDMSSTDYHKSPAIGSTSLKYLLRSPAHYIEKMRAPDEATPAMKFGTDSHSAILEPSKFRADYIITPDVDRRTKEGKASWEQFQVIAQNKTVITHDQHDKMQGMIKAIETHPYASKLIKSGHSEQSYFWTDEKTGVDCKCRPDFLREGHIVVDIKTTYDASPETFAKTVANFGYHISAAHYLDGVSAVTGKTYDTFVFVAIETAAPFAIGVYILDESSLEKGRELQRRALGVFAECKRTGIYPGYDEHIQAIALPAWAWGA